MYRIKLAALFVVATVLLVMPSTASAGFVALPTGGANDVLIGGTSGDDVFLVTESMGLLVHNRAGDAGFNSSNDWDTSLAGDQTIPADGTSTITVFLHEGNDVAQVMTSNVEAFSVAGQDGDDTITGSTKAELIDGGPGADHIVGGKGADTVTGGDGDDVFVWTNGDGSDVFDGQAGADTVRVEGSPVSGDTFSAVTNGARISFVRTNLGLFSLDIGTSERLEVIGLAGNDTFSAGAGLGALVELQLDGGDGNDTLVGAEGVDQLIGGSGNDAITGGSGADIIDAGAGDDAITANDGVIDAISCGAGTDSASVDLGEGSSQCEQLNSPLPPADPTPPKATIGAAKVTAKRFVKGRYRATVPLVCNGSFTCTGTLYLSSVKTFPVLGTRVIVLLGKASYSIPAGATRSVSLVLPSSARALARNHVFSATALADTVAADGAIRRATRKLTVRLPV